MRVGLVHDVRFSNLFTTQLQQNSQKRGKPHH